MPKGAHLAIAVCLASQLAGGGQRAVEPAERDARTVKIKSTLDGAEQPARFFVPPAAAAGSAGPRVPLLVALHTWSGGYNQRGWWAKYLAECRTRGWALVHPHFRGPNRRPEACVSGLAVQDVLDAVAYATRQARIDGRRIYLVGVSGGGHMALAMAHRAPKLWAGVSAWAGISDLLAWHGECKKAKRGYYRDVEACCGGPPGPATEAEYRKRSPLFHLAGAKGLPIDINAGIHDGHTGSVPVSHSLRAFNVLAEANGHRDKVLTDGQIGHMVERRTIPAALAAERVDEPGRRRRILFRRAAGPARVTLFDGGHEGDEGAAIRWLARQAKP